MSDKALPKFGEVRQVSNQLYVWRRSVNSTTAPSDLGQWMELATFDKSSEAAYVGAIVERAMRLALLA